MLTQQYLQSILEYNPDTGLFIWRISPAKNVKKGSIAGCVKNGGYIVISINKKQYNAHRLVFLYMTGSMPRMVDHKNQIKGDNRWCNLRQCSPLENLWNRKGWSGRDKNVYWNPDRNSWRVLVSTYQGLKYIGSYKDYELATLIAGQARLKYQKEFTDVTA